MKKFLLTCLLLLMTALPCQAQHIVDELTLPVGVDVGMDISDAYVESSNPGVLQAYQADNGRTIFSAVSPGSALATIYLPDGEELLYLFTVVDGDGQDYDDYDNDYDDDDDYATPAANNYDNGYADADSAADFAQEVLRIANVERAKVGAPPLRLSADLNQSCAVRAAEIVEYFSHTRPNGTNFDTAVRNNGRRALGENIAAGSSTPAAVMEQWMNSPGHRANILNAKFRELGVGYTENPNSTYTHYWVQIFRG